MTALRHDHLERPHPQRFPGSQPIGASTEQLVLQRHRVAVDAGVATYTDPVTGYQVFTAAHLADVGTCCDNGCRHCPFIGADERR